MNQNLKKTFFLFFFFLGGGGVPRVSGFFYQVSKSKMKTKKKFGWVGGG